MAFERRRAIGGGVILLAIVALAFFTVRRFIAAPAQDLTFQTYFPGSNDVDETTRVVYRRSVIGIVQGIEPTVLGMQVQVVAYRVPSVTQVTTLRVGESVRVTTPLPLTLQLVSPVAADLQYGSQALSLARTRTGSWLLTGTDSLRGITLNGAPLAVDPRINAATIMVGDRLGFGTVDIVWSELVQLTHVTLAIDTTRLRAVANRSGAGERPLDAILGPSSAIAVAGGFGRPRVELELRPSFTAFTAVETSVAELTPIAAFDPIATATGLLGYVSTPANLRLPPANRFEMAVADANVVLTRFAALAEQVRLAGEGPPQGTVGRMFLSETQQADVAKLLAGAEDARAAIARANAVASWLDVAMRDTLRRGELLHQVLDSGYLKLGSALARVDSLAAELSNRDLPVIRRVAGPEADSILKKANLTFARADTIVNKADSAITKASRDLNEIAGDVKKVASPLGKYGPLAFVLLMLLEFAEDIATLIR